MCQKDKFYFRTSNLTSIELLRRKTLRTDIDHANKHVTFLLNYLYNLRESLRSITVTSWFLRVTDSHLYGNNRFWLKTIEWCCQWLLLSIYHCVLILPSVIIIIIITTVCRIIVAIHLRSVQLFVRNTTLIRWNRLQNKQKNILFVIESTMKYFKLKWYAKQTRGSMSCSGAILMPV